MSQGQKEHTDSMGHFEASSLALFWVPDRPMLLQGQHPKHEAGSVVSLSTRWLIR